MGKSDVLVAFMEEIYMNNPRVRQIESDIEILKKQGAPFIYGSVEQYQEALKQLADALDEITGNDHC